MKNADCGSQAQYFPPWKIGDDPILHYLITNNSSRSRHHERCTEQARKRAATECEGTFSQSNLNLVCFGLELANTGVEIGNGACRWKVSDSILLEIGNLWACIKEHPIIATGNSRCENRNAHELR